jgi:hypothetical protein
VRHRSVAGALLTVLSVGTIPLTAQRSDSVRVGPSALPPVDTLPTALTTAAPKPPITPTRAALQSLIVPGWGQASLDRGTAGAIFVTVEAISVAMFIQSKAQLQSAERVGADSVIGSRQQAVEDWKVLIIFNHLLAAADAFVAAHLWNVPIEVGRSPSNKQTLIGTHVTW